MWKTVHYKNTRVIPIKLFWYFKCYLGTYFTLFSSVSTVVFEKVSVSWINSGLVLPKTVFTFHKFIMNLYCSTRWFSSLNDFDVNLETEQVSITLSSLINILTVINYRTNWSKLGTSLKESRKNKWLPLSPNYLA